MAQNITRRNFLKGSAIGALGAAGALIPTASLYARRAPARREPDNNRNKQPNIVMYIFDDHGLDFLGCYGNKDIQTPNIGTRAIEGMPPHTDPARNKM